LVLSKVNDWRKQMNEEKAVKKGPKALEVVVMLGILICIAGCVFGYWHFERWFHWKLSYGPKLEERVDALEKRIEKLEKEQ
jgi:hypothetical protein